MPEFMISGIPVNFPFKPYDVQTAYMEKVIECLQNSTNGILESPTGTGKTLSLLCSTLAWVLLKKAQVQTEANQIKESIDECNDLVQRLNDVAGMLGNAAGVQGANWGVPKIIYASRTHSQLSQAMQELKRTSYNFMNAVIIGSRDQLCIHPDVMKEETNNGKMQMCKLKIVTRTCIFHRNVESKKDHPAYREAHIMDIEDLVKAGQTVKACPYFVSKELVQNADIIFMPYNYLLDPKARRANKIDLTNTIIILDEAHNVEKMCEDSASIQIKSSDIATCIDDVTQIMKAMSKDSDVSLEIDDTPKDFTLDDLVVLKEMLLNLEKAVDNIEIKNIQDGVTFPGSYIFDILQNADITTINYQSVLTLLENLTQYLTTVSEKNSYVRKGVGLQILSDLLTIVFAENDSNYRERIRRCFKVHINVEESKTKPKKADGWLSVMSTSGKSDSKAKIISYWCFNPGFGMDQLMNKNVRSILLTSGTLAPLKPLISELGIPVAARLENPHIIGKSQICVKIVSNGPDREILNSSFDNRNNPKYIASLGRTILSFSQVIPHGMLIFFPSYPVMSKCQDSWQASGLWNQISKIKPIYVEPRSKESFLNVMSEFYQNINDPIVKGAIFMAVCRGKVSEGLDFADINGRAVLITGLPFPPLKDPRVILKKRYLQENRTRENELLSGDEWYVLEAARAVNQAIGRVIRHKDDYGAILLCDNRFNNPRQKSQLSKWIQCHLNMTQQQNTNFGPLIGEVSRFFRNAERTLVQPGLKPLLESEGNYSTASSMNSSNASFDDKPGPSYSQIYPKQNIQNAIKIKIEPAYSPSNFNPEVYSKGSLKEKPKDFFSALDVRVEAIDFNNPTDYTPHSSLVKIHKRERSNEELENTQIAIKKKKFKLVSVFNQNTSVLNIPKDEPITKDIPEDRTELLKLIRSSISKDSYKKFLTSLTQYQKENDFNVLYSALESIFGSPELLFILKGMHRFIKEPHKNEFFSKIELI